MNKLEDLGFSKNNNFYEYVEEDVVVEVYIEDDVVVRFMENMRGEEKINYRTFENVEKAIEAIKEFMCWDEIDSEEDL